MVLVMSFPLYFLIGCMRGFPKRVVLPMILFTSWVGLFFALPLPIFLGIRNTVLLLSIVQPCLGIVTLVILRYSAENRQWLHSRSDFEQLAFRWKRLFGFVAANVILVIPLLGVCLAVSLSLAISHLSRGFVHLGFRGISVEARTYLYEGKNIFLLPTAHVAQPTFYKRLVEPLSVENTVVIPEGVTDKNKLLKESLDYSKLARRMGAEAQDNRTIVADRSMELCDVDISEFSPITIDYLRTCISISGDWLSGDRAMALQKCISAPDPDLDLLWKDLVEFRNRRIIECITDHMQTYEHIVIPWGAAHMPGIERAILNWGGTIVGRRRIQVWDWSSQE
ncbi:hypothetical protein ACFLQR_04115 [Verrucomicrobiota bacterium]